VLQINRSNNEIMDKMPAVGEMQRNDEDDCQQEICGWTGETGCRRESLMAAGTMELRGVNDVE